MRRSVIRLNQLIEKVLKIDASYFVGSGAYALIQQVVGLVCGLGVAYAFGHWLPKSIFGEYNLILSTLSMVMFVGMPGMNTALIKPAAKNFDGTFWQVISIRFWWSLFGSVCLLIAAYYFSANGSDVLPSLLVFVASLFPVYSVMQTVSSFLVAKKRFGLIAFFSILSSILAAGLMMAAIWFTGDLLYILAGYLLGQIVPGVFSLYFAIKLIRNKKVSPDLLPYGYFLTLTQALPNVIGHFSGVYVAVLIGVEGLAVYSVAMKFNTMLLKNLDVFFKPVTVKLAGQTHEEHGKTFSTHAIKFIIFGLCLFAVLYISLPTLIQIFYTDKYLEAVYYARIYSVTAIVIPIYFLLRDVVVFQRRVWLKAFTDIVMPVLKLAGYFIFVPQYGLWGLMIVLVAEMYIFVFASSVVLLFDG